MTDWVWVSPFLWMNDWEWASHLSWMTDWVWVSPLLWMTNWERESHLFCGWLTGSESHLFCDWLTRSESHLFCEWLTRSESHLFCEWLTRGEPHPRYEVWNWCLTCLMVDSNRCKILWWTIFWDILLLQLLESSRFCFLSDLKGGRTAYMGGKHRIAFNPLEKLIKHALRKYS